MQDLIITMFAVVATLMSPHTVERQLRDKVEQGWQTYQQTESESDLQVFIESAQTYYDYVTRR